MEEDSQQIIHFGIETLKSSKTANLEKWGKDCKHNTCYVTGHAGSGKTTVALSIKRPKDILIQLDSYSQINNIKNTAFDNYLDETVKNWRKIASATCTGENETIMLCGEEYWDIVNEFRKALELYSENEFMKDRRVIVEGIQILDNWLYPCISCYIGKPIIILTTDIFTSMQRVAIRDTMESEDMIGYLNWYMDTEKRLNDLIRVTSAI